MCVSKPPPMRTLVTWEAGPALLQKDLSLTDDICKGHVLRSPGWDCCV